MSAKINLEVSGRNYGACAKAIQIKCANALAPSAKESELLIGFGIASDWVRRSAALQPLRYSKRLMNKSSKSPAVTEVIRFTMAWSGLNALFARPEVMKLLGLKMSGGELALFKSLLVASATPATKINAYKTTLHNVLARVRQSAVPGHPIGSQLTTLQVLHEKFTPAPYRSFGVGRAIQAAIQKQSMSQLDLATMIYAMRNWSVHGGLIGSSFGSVPGFNIFIGAILEATSEIHLNVSKQLLSKV
ncbi:hypothetical protein WDZ92_38780 [Nostoc sp. NIES-2111]